MTNEQLAALLTSLQTQLRDAIKAAERLMPTDAERKMEWWDIKEDEKRYFPRRDQELIEGEVEERPTGDFVALGELFALLGTIHAMTKRLNPKQ